VPFNFAVAMFRECRGDSFEVASSFKFPKLTQSEMNTAFVFLDTFYGITNPQTITATSIINGNPTPNNLRYTFSNAFSDYDELDSTWKQVYF
jgi:hypothetical protein